MRKTGLLGFSLAEVLIVIVIMGVIGAFAVPKVLTGDSQSHRYSQIANNAAASLVLALDAHRLSGNLSASTKTSDLTAYLNYVKVETSGSVDSYQDGGSRSCASYTCLRLHNGAILHYNPSISFGGTATTNAIWYGIDPDGRVTGGSKGMSIVVFQYYTGQMRTYDTIYPNTSENGWTYVSPCVGCDPSWFSWQN